MKKSFYVLTSALAAMSLFFAVSCGSSEPDQNSPGKKVPDPVGTISVAMRNAANNATWVTPAGYYYGFYIGGDNNFRSNYHYEYAFASIGAVSGLGNVNYIPQSGWANPVAATPGYGYVAKCMDSSGSVIAYVRIYVVDYILDAISGGIIGANIKYQSPFVP